MKEKKTIIKEKIEEIRNKVEDKAVELIAFAQAHPVVTMAATTVVSTVVSSVVSYKVGEWKQSAYYRDKIVKLVYGDGGNVVNAIDVNGQKYSIDDLTKIAKDADHGNYEGFNTFRLFVGANCLELNDGQTVSLTRNGPETSITSPGYVFNPNM